MVLNLQFGYSVQNLIAEDYLLKVILPEEVYDIEY